MSRFYYAAFHHVHALLVSEGLQAKTHSGAHALLYSHFVKTGKIPSRIAQRFAQLQKYREQADYTCALRFEEAHAREEAENARAICGAIGELLRAAGWFA